MTLFAEAGGIAEPDRGRTTRGYGRHAVSDEVFLRLRAMVGHLFFELVAESTAACEKSEFFAKARKPVHAGLLAIIQRAMRSWGRWPWRAARGYSQPAARPR